MLKFSNKINHFKIVIVFKITHCNLSNSLPRNNICYVDSNLRGLKTH